MEMAYKQINLTLPESLRKKAEEYAEEYGFKNIQELATSALREKVFDDYDESFTTKEVEMVETLLAKSLKSGKMVSEAQLMEKLG